MIANAKTQAGLQVQQQHFTPRIYACIKLLLSHFVRLDLCNSQISPPSDIVSPILLLLDKGVEGTLEETSSRRCLKHVAQSDVKFLKYSGTEAPYASIDLPRILALLADCSCSAP